MTLLNIGDTIYLVANPDDGGGWSPQCVKVVEVSKVKNAFVGYVPTEGRRGFRMEDENKIWYSSHGACWNVCCQRNGFKDAFDCWCQRTGVKQQDREAELNKQLEIFGAASYEDLCNMIQ